MPIFSSTKKFWTEANRIKGYPLSEKLHGYFYLRFPFFYIATATGSNRLGKFGARLITLVNKIFPPKSAKPGQITFADTYHGKVVPLQTAKELISVKQNIKVDDLEKVIPYQLARSLIIDHPESLVALDCPCRVARENPCLPLDVCLIVGEPFASFTLEHHPTQSRSINHEEAIAILEAEEARGHVHHAFFKEAVLQRFYAICNCCSCCCGAMQAHSSGTPMLASSGYTAHVNKALCIGCGTCEPFCQFDAIEIQNGLNQINLKACMGCGICVSHCDQKAVELILTPSRGMPLEMGKVLSQA
ncbi:MAG: 4Fe-4S ferredoxin [Chloroflexi bacterium HGW-Chloroflexi-4]|jgi:Pyruvate/2-oxoacid:ferredoxin oxidoreductase delta subunit|nr:MAG: 4Fe-4S ferredoxin [Chloroflexi bacterium HGW-Chloroflexi-4]